MMRLAMMIPVVGDAIRGALRILAYAALGGLLAVSSGCGVSVMGGLLVTNAVNSGQTTTPAPDGNGFVIGPAQSAQGETAFAVPDVALQPGAEPVIAPGTVSNVERYLLAVAVGWSGQNAIIATAISIAEDGSGNPAALSAANFDSSRDLGLWQINSQHWPSCGGRDALVVPINNARCGFGIYRAAGNSFCPWSTFGTFETCHILGHDNSYAKHLGEAADAARVAASGG